MFEFVNYPWTSVLSLAVLTFVINIFCCRDSDYPANGFLDSLLEWIVLGIIAAGVFVVTSHTDGDKNIPTISFINLFCSLVFLSNLLIVLDIVVVYFWKKFDGTERYEKYCDQRQVKKQKDEVIENAENICGKMQLPTTAKAELGKLLKEWKIVNKEIVPVKKLLEQHEVALAKVKGLHKEALAHQNNVSDKDLKDSYANMAKELFSQCDKIQEFVNDDKAQVDEKNARIGELLKLFKQAKKDAESYKEYDKFTTEALEVQKELKDTLLKTKKTK